MIGFEITPGAGAGPGDPLAQAFRHGGGTRVGVSGGPSGGLHLWSEIGQGRVARLRLDGDDPTGRLSWRELRTGELRNVYPVSDFALTGSWSQLQTSGSGLSGSYTGNRCVSTSSLGAQIAVTVERAEVYDIWVHYTGRTGGALCAVTIDGGTALVNEIGDPGGLGAPGFSTHSATDLDRRRSVLVASGLTGAHQVVLRQAGAASPGGTTLMIEALSITGAPGEARVLPPLWQAGRAYVMGDEVLWDGTFYSARATGTSGPQPPAHLAGIGSDGALDWRADYATTYMPLAAMDYASEREYAARLTAGAGREVGGQTHGGEVLLSRAVRIDGAPFVAPASGAGIAAGAVVEVEEVTEWRDATGATVATCRLDRRLTPGAMAQDLRIDVGAAPVPLDWLYLAMLPFVHWDGEEGAIRVEEAGLPDGTLHPLAPFAGAAGQVLEHPGQRRIALEGPGLMQALEVRLTAGGGAVEGLDLRLLPNVDGRSATGTTDWPGKAYVVADCPGGSLPAGARIEATARWLWRALPA